jgi:TFIIF-interacting CTD phosphatase-like protein
MNSKHLFLLDLDHTLIFGSFAASETSDLLFEYSPFLKVYERPYARSFIKEIQALGEIIVFTTAKEDYAKIICEKLDIRPIKILSRANCKRSGESFKKVIRKGWIKTYDRIIIIDDSPQVWVGTENHKIELLVPKEFYGDVMDRELLSLIDKLKVI